MSIHRIFADYKNVVKAKGVWKSLCLIVALFQALAPAAQVVVSAELDSSEIMIGDQVGLHLFINHDPDVKIRHINLGALDEIKEIEILNINPLDTLAREPEFILEQRLMLTSFDSGYYFIPPLTVDYVQNGRPGSVQTGQLALLVNTFPITGDSLHLEPIKSIIEEGVNFLDFLPYLAAVAAAAAIGFLIYYLVNRKKNEENQAPPEIIRPAHEIALDKLEKLKLAKLWQQGLIKQYQSELTYIVREYLENRFKISALELTSDEILREMRIMNIDPEWREKLKSIFRTADLVKFAKAEPPVTIHEEAMEAVEQFVRTTRYVETRVAEETPQSE